MGALAMPFENLPLGFRFKPTDVELIDHYLRLKINGRHGEVACITEVDICRVEPWDLPDLSAIKTNDHEWFFFCPRDRKYPNGSRSNRATTAGYWKATGKDRTIKSRKMGLIGMKKTLVFYTGRAPKGKRTNWVIHEYRPTIEELDGTNPGQGAFVLCRLFKKVDDLKPDDNDDASNTDEVETNACSPNVNSHEEMTSMPAIQPSPLSNPQTVEQSAINKHRVVKTSDSMASETVLPDLSHSNSYGHHLVDSKVPEEMNHEVDSELNDPMKQMYGSPDTSNITHPQMHVHQEPASMGTPFTMDIGDSHSGFDFQDFNGGDHISDFLDSAIIDPDDHLYKGPISHVDPIHGSQMWKTADIPWWMDESVKESGSCSGSDVEFAQAQHDVGFVGGITSEKYFNDPGGNEPAYNKQVQAFADDDNIFSDAALDRFCNMPNNAGESMYYFEPPEAFPSGYDVNSRSLGTGIKIRTPNRRRQDPSSFAKQGAAPRRIRLKMPSSESPSFEFEEKDPEGTLTDEGCLAGESPPHEDILYLAELTEKTAGGDEEIESNMKHGEVVETGIKIRTRLRKSHPTPPSSMEQGITRRRIHLQMEFGSPQNTRDVDETNSSEEVGEKISDDTSDGGCDKKLLKRTKSGGYMTMKVIMIVVLLFVAFVGLWKARNLVLVSS